MPQATVTINTELIFIILAGFAIVISLWMIVYFSAKIIAHFYIRSQLGDMPTAEEISAHYERLNKVIQEIQEETTRSITEGLDNA